MFITIAQQKNLLDDTLQRKGLREYLSMDEYDKIVLLASSPMLLAIAIGIIWDVIDMIKKIFKGQ